MLSLNLISIRANYWGKGHSFTESMTLFKMYWYPIILILLYRDIHEDKNELPKHFHVFLLFKSAGKNSYIVIDKKISLRHE